MSLVDSTSEFDPTIYEFDPRPSDLLVPQDARGERIAVIRTSDRISFRRCRRRWAWGSHLRANLGPLQNADPLWMGSGFHFALEDFHGDQRFGSAAIAFEAYALASIEHNRAKVPADWKALTTLATAMLDYYQNFWLRSRDPLKTWYWNGKPQVEVNYRIEIPWERGHHGFDRVICSGTLDRVIVDEWGQLWIVEYKTAKAIQTLHLGLDPQVTNYCWAGNQLYDRPIAGVIYQQHLKDIPEPPKILANGTISADKRQRTTRTLYRSALINLYGDVLKAPKVNVDTLNHLTMKETQESDIFVRRNKAERNEHQCQAEGTKILMEAEEMLNPDLPLYPNPTRDCVYLCPFNGPCVGLDAGEDWEGELKALMVTRDPVYDSWRAALRYPNQIEHKAPFQLALEAPPNG